jgi:hypothetical protein
MAQETDEKTGKDIPTGDGAVSDEDVNAIDDGCGKTAATGQDHSTEDYEKTMPTEGVGAVQDNSDTTSDVARIED